MISKALKRVPKTLDVIFHSPEHVAGQFYRAHIKLCRSMTDIQFWFYHLATFLVSILGVVGIVTVIPLSGWITWPIAAYAWHWFDYAPMEEYHVRLNAAYEADIKAGRIDLNSRYNRFCDWLAQKLFPVSYQQEKEQRDHQALSTNR